jgi:hypothetical protein
MTTGQFGPLFLAQGHEAILNRSVRTPSGINHPRQKNPPGLFLN